MQQKAPNRQSIASIVAIDDNPRTLEFSTAALAQPELEILTATDAHEGLEFVYKRHPQIVLTDLVMPGMSGLEVLERIMEIDHATDVILMTAHSSSETAVEAIQKGASDYLNKPVPLTTLRARLQKAVEEVRTRQRVLNL